MEKHPLKTVPGTAGYSGVTDRFIERSESVDSLRLHHCLLPLLPREGCRALDLGAGSGRDAAALAGMAYDVVAVEPLAEFLDAARSLHESPGIRWVCDSLPELGLLPSGIEPFDFVLCHAVWQHLSPEERGRAIRRIAALLRPGGVLGLGLRHGPPGAGTHYFPATSGEAIELAASVGLVTELCLEDQPSEIPGKSDVTWTRLAFAKR